MENLKQNWPLFHVEDEVVVADRSNLQKGTTNSKQETPQLLLPLLHMHVGIRESANNAQVDAT